MPKNSKKCKLSKVEIYTDGSCRINPGPGAYCVLIKENKKKVILSDSAKLTTNNEMELKAVVVGLKALAKPSDVLIRSDSKYVCDAINKGWLNSWKANGWKKSDSKPIANLMLWKELDKLMQKHKVTFKWIKGHSGILYNDVCDKIARRESGEKLQKMQKKKKSQNAAAKKTQNSAAKTATTKKNKKKKKKK